MNIEGDARNWYRKQVSQDRSGKGFAPALNAGINSARNKLRTLDVTCAGCPNLDVRVGDTSRSAHSFNITCAVGLNPLDVTMNTAPGQQPECKVLTT